MDASGGDWFMQLRAAKSWGLTPNEFRARPYEEQLEMIAEVAASSKMENYETYLMERKAAQKIKE